MLFRSWLTVTFLTAPEPRDVLIAFYRRTRPSVSGWRPIAALAPDVRASSQGWWNFIDWISGCALIYGFLFGTGKLLLHEVTAGLLLLGLGIAGGAVIYFDLTRRGWSAVTE